MLELAKGFAERGHNVDLIRTYKEWPDFDRDSKIRIINLSSRCIQPFLGKKISFRLRVILLSLTLLPKLALYLRKEQPDVLIAGLLTVVAIWARELARVPTKVIISVQGWPRPKRLHHPIVWRWTYPRADAVVADIEGVGDEVARITGIPRQKIKVIYNPVIDDTILEKAKEPLDHPWFQPGEPPVILGVGRLTRQKDFPTLVRAFAQVRKEIPARLVIIGKEGEDKPKLEALIRELGLEQDVDMPGFVDNPYKYMARAGVFVLSSLWEGPGHVLIEALAVGCPVVSTDCPSGPREILLNGQCGVLVPMKEPEAMAKAILDVLRNPDKAKQLIEESREHIGRFRPDTAVNEYLALIEDLCAGQ